MRKLRPAEIRFLEAIPKDLEIGDRAFEGCIRPWEWPKGTQPATVWNLWLMGYLKIKGRTVHDYPFGLTPDGRIAIDRKPLKE